MTLSISVIIPAHNAAKTLLETLDSVRKQTREAWEAIVVDDGSSDETVAIATSIAAQDSRFRVVSQAQGGVSVARNHGIRLAQYDWLLFLDADDWIAPNFLEKMTAALSEQPQSGWVCCSWARVTPEGHLLPEAYSQGTESLFAKLSRTCTFAVHACIVRKALVEAVGGFDPALRTCEDWDLWQRIARTGTPLAVVNDVLAYYRMRPNSASIDGKQMLRDAIHIINQGHRADARVTNPLPQYQNGHPLEGCARAKLQWVAWAAGLVIGSGQDATDLLSVVEQKEEPGMEPYEVAYSLFYAAILPTCQPLTAWHRLWSEFYPHISAFLKQLEAHSSSFGLAHRSQLMLEHLILEQVVPETALTLGLTHAKPLEVTEPVTHLYAPSGIDRFYGYITLEGKQLGTIELPICDGWMAAEVLVDAIAAKFAWPILGRFFQHTIYPSAALEELETLHDQSGWDIFLQQLWNRSDWSGDRFYDAGFTSPAPVQNQLMQPWLTHEISEELPDLKVTGTELLLSLTVGGVPFSGFSIPVVDGQVTAQAIRTAVTLEGGFELCVAVVREALIGKPLTEPISLWQRLAEAAQQRQAVTSQSINAAGCLDRQPQGMHPTPEMLDDACVKQNHHQAFQQYAVCYGGAPLNEGLIVGRRAGAMGTSVCRRAMLPIATAAELWEEAIALQQPVQCSDNASLKWALYAPEWFTRETIQQSLQQRINTSDGSSDINISNQNRNNFETLFATQPDPWKYTSEYEQTKYEQTLSLIPQSKVNNVLELACAEGHFTVQLAAKVKRLLATDISQIALERTAERCNQFKHIDFKRLDLVADDIPGTFELVICSEVLYYVGSKTDLKNVALKMMNAVEPGGYILMAHAHVVADEPDCAGFDWMVPFGARGISDTFSSIPELRLSKEIWTPLYRVQLFQRLPKFEFPWQRSTPQFIRLTEQPTALPPKVEAHVLWHGGEPQVYEDPPITTERLPILMYHRVAPTGADRMSRWRVTPKAFEQQLQYLRDAGYYSVSWDAWREAVAARRPLPGRAIAFTFDDGYLDFYTYAQPLLQAYGFSATVFLVANRVGQTNRWDQGYGEEVPLMNWEQIRQLQAQGIEFGSHSASHYPLTCLSVEEMVKEGVRSRTILTQELGHSISTIAYPYGDVDPVVQHVMGACGYTIGVSCRSGRSSFRDSLLLLPRLEIEGADSLRTFVQKLSGHTES